MRNIVMKINVDDLSAPDIYKILEKVPTEFLLNEIWRRSQEKETEIRLMKERYLKNDVV